MGQLSEGALFSVTCSISEPVIVQVLAIYKLEDKCRIFVSDGSTYMCADIDKQSIEGVKRFDVMRMELEFKGLNNPLRIRRVENLNKNRGKVIGSPISFSDFMKNGFESKRNSEKSVLKIDDGDFAADKVEDIITQPIIHIHDDANSNQETTQKIRIENFNNENSNSEEGEISNTIPFNKSKTLIENYEPIDMLYEGIRGWIILGRVLRVQSKQIISNKNKTRQFVQVLNFTIIDHRQNRIQCSAFQESAQKYKHLIKKHHLYQFSKGKIINNNKTSQLNIRFQLQSVINQIPSYLEPKQAKIPKHFFKLISINNLEQNIEKTQIDIAGIVKQILTKQIGSKEKYRVKLILADPIVGKQIDVVLNIQQQMSEKIKNNSIIVLTSMKIFTALDGTISLKSGFKTDVINEFDEEDHEVKQLLPFLKVPLKQLTSLSRSFYKTRTLKTHLQALQLAPYFQKIYSKINLFVMQPSHTNKSCYDACTKCSRKINKQSTFSRRSNYCQNYSCRQIVQTKKQYCIHMIFSDWNTQIKLSLFKESAKTIMQIDPSQFIQLSEQQQKASFKNIKYKQVSVCIFSHNNMGELKHEISFIDEPHKDNLELIRNMIDIYEPFKIKQEAL